MRGTEMMGTDRLVEGKSLLEASRTHNAVVTPLKILEGKKQYVRTFT